MRALVVLFLICSVVQAKELPETKQGPLRQAQTCEWADGEHGVIASREVDTLHGWRGEIWICPALKRWRVRGFGIGKGPKTRCTITAAGDGRRGRYDYEKGAKEIARVCGSPPHFLFIYLSSPTEKPEVAVKAIKDGHGVLIRQCPDLVSRKEWEQE